MVGLPWEQHVTFLDEPQRAARHRARGSAKASRRAPDTRPCSPTPSATRSPPRSSAGTAPHKIERFIQRLYNAVKAEDPTRWSPTSIIPRTEYLYLPFLDFVCFNVYLESRERLEAYLARLQNIAGDRPLVMAEIGLDSLRNGEERQARAMEWQIRAVFAAGVRGRVRLRLDRRVAPRRARHRRLEVRPDHRDRKPKARPRRRQRAYADTPSRSDRTWPSVSVVVCSRNGARTIADASRACGASNIPTTK